MVDVIVTFRDAVFSALLAWGGVGGDLETTSGPAVGKEKPELPAATSSPIEKAVGHTTRTLC